MAKQKLALSRVLTAIDKKDRGFYDTLTEAEQKEISPLVLMRFISSSGGTQEMQEWYLRATNEYVNKNFWDISAKDHKKLQWLILTTVSPNMGSMFHKWIPMNKEKSSCIQELFPKANADEIKTIEHIYTKDEIRDIAREQGWDAKRIKKI